ncbi:aldehyde dehydrogenase family protein [Mesorhizobium sp. M0510]|uniref:aldehyde dehydrogenase family protein n=1 Tax=Mesorhizobium sp. M0510 TaxID=2956954 RepID=UPI003338B85F
MSETTSTFASDESNNHMTDSRNFYSLVDGALVHDGSKFKVINPATQGTVGAAIVPGAKVLQQAIDAADRAFVTWRAEQWTVRSNLLLALADVLRKNVEELARPSDPGAGKTASASFETKPSGVLNFLNPVQVRSCALSS